MCLWTRLYTFKIKLVGLILFRARICIHYTCACRLAMVGVKWKLVGLKWNEIVMCILCYPPVNIDSEPPRYEYFIRYSCCSDPCGWRGLELCTKRSCLVPLRHVSLLPCKFDPRLSVLPLFKIRYPEINSENSWNFTKYPEILQNVQVFYMIKCIWCY